MRRLLVFPSLFLLCPALLLGQANVAVTTTAGDQSLGSLGWAVTTLNNAGGGSVSLTSETFITLTQPLPSASQDVTLIGSPVHLTAESSAQGLMTFQQDLALGNAFTFSLENNGNLSLGLDSSVTAAQWISGTNSSALIKAGKGADLNSTPGSPKTAPDGGQASLSAVTILMDDALNLVVQGGAGGDLFDTGGSGDAGGDGGNGVLTAASMAVTSSDLAIRGGVGGSVLDGSATNSTGGDGGSASVSIGSLILTGGGDIDITGVRGGNGTHGGDGGQATALLGSFLLSTGNFDVTGGNGQDGIDTGGVGGNAFVSIGSSLTIQQTSNFRVFGGLGSTGSTGATQGGDATWLGGPTSISGTFSNIQVKGGDGGNMSSSAGPYDGGNGGDASVSLTALNAGVGAAIVVQGGLGGNGGSGTNGGDGGDGGNTTLSLGSFSIGVSTQMDFAGGNGGLAGQADAAGDAGDGGEGGDLNVTVSNLTIGAGSNLNLSGGVGQNGGDTASGGTGGDAGDGGSSTFIAGAVTLGVGSSLNVNGGNAGLGGVGAVSGVAGQAGSASISIVSLDGSGNVNVGGATAQLWVESGTFSGVLSGNATLQKAVTGILRLSGNHSYSGGTSILAGDLLITGGRLGTGTVFNDAYMYYQNNASAVGSTILNDQNLTFQDTSTAADAVITNSDNLYFMDDATAGTANITTSDYLQFSDNATAGAATLTVNNGGIVGFYDTTLGGTARFIVNSGGDFDISNHGGGLTVGSIEGAGDFGLGSNDLTVGSNDLDATVSGVISGTGGLLKYGTGVLTLSGTNTYSGMTQAYGGGILVGNGSAVGSGTVVVDGGAFLGTTGAPLTLQVNSLAINDGTLRLQLGGAGASGSDGIQALNSINLTGDLDLTEDGTLSALAMGSSVTLMTASNVYGMFANVTETLNGNGRYLPTYFSDRVELLSINPDFTASGLTPNQKAIGADLDGIYGDGRVYDLVLGLGPMSDPNFQAAADQLSPAGLTGLYQAGFIGARSLASQVEQRLTGPGAVRTSQSSIGSVLFQDGSGSSKIQGFLLGDGGVMSVTGDGNGTGYQATSYGVGGAGVDLELAPGITGGVLMGYNHIQVDVEDGGLLAADNAQLGFYGSYTKEGFHVWGMAEGGLNSYKTERAAYGGTAEGTTSGLQLSGALGTGYDWKFGNVSAGPFGSVQYTRLEMNAFQETGSFGPLSFPAQGADSLMSRLGARFGGDLKMGTLGLKPEVRAAWVKEFSDEGGSLQAGFGTGDSFTVAGAQVGQSGFQVGASVGLTFPGNLGLSLQYQGDLGRQNLDSQRFSAGMQVGF